MSAVNEAFDTIVRDALETHISIALHAAALRVHARGHNDAATYLLSQVEQIKNERVADHFAQLALVRAERQARMGRDEA